MIKRQMYGRAKPDLLRKRVLLADLPGHDNYARATATWPLTKTQNYNAESRSRSMAT
jgi:hypothetical protein